MLAAIGDVEAIRRQAALQQLTHRRRPLACGARSASASQRPQLVLGEHDLQDSARVSSATTWRGHSQDGLGYAPVGQNRCKR